MADPNGQARREQFDRIVATDTEYQLPGYRQSPEEIQQDLQFVTSKMAELAQARCQNDPDELNQLQSRIQPFLEATRSAGLFMELLAAFRNVEHSNKNVIALFVLVISKFAPTGRRDLVDMFLLFMPQGWRQDDLSKTGVGHIFIDVPGRGHWTPMGAYPAQP